MRKSLVCLGLGLVLCLASTAEARKVTGKKMYKRLVKAMSAQESNQYLIELAGGGPADLAGAVAAAGGRLVHRFPELGAASAISEAPGFARNLAKTKGVQRVSRDLMVQWIPESFGVRAHEGPAAAGHLANPNLAAFRPCQWNLDQINAAGAWGQGEFGAGAVVAVLDTGVSGDPAWGSFGHIDMAGKVVGNVTMVSVNHPVCAGFGALDAVSPLDYNLHGTFVSGVAAAHGFGIAGVAPDAGIYGVKVLNCLGGGSFSDVIAGILHAANVPAVDVINMSLGSHFPKNLPGAGPVLGLFGKAIGYAQGVKGKLVVSAAGNGAVDLDHNRNFVALPAEAGNGMSVWAGDVDGNLAGYSNHGVSGTQVGAGGGDVTPGSPNLPIPGCVFPPVFQDGVASICSPDSVFLPICSLGNFFLIGGTGTSFASPAVAGVGALVSGKYPFLNGNQLKSVLQGTADDLGARGVDNTFSHGRVNASNAVQ